MAPNAGIHAAAISVAALIVMCVGIMVADGASFLKLKHGPVVTNTALGSIPLHAYAHLRP